MSTRDDHHPPPFRGQQERPLMVHLESISLPTIQLHTELLPLNSTLDVLPLPSVDVGACGRASAASFGPHVSRTVILFRDLPKSTRSFILDLRRQWLQRQQKVEAWCEDQHNRDGKGDGVLAIEGGVATMKFQCIRKIAQDICQGDFQKAEAIFEKVERGWEFIHTMEVETQDSEDESSEIDDTPEVYIGHHDNAGDHENIENGAEGWKSGDVKNSQMYGESITSLSPKTSPPPIGVSSPAPGPDSYYTVQGDSHPAVSRPNPIFRNPFRFSSHPNLRADKPSSSTPQVAQAYAVRLHGPFGQSASPGSLRRQTSLILLPPPTASGLEYCTVVESKPSLKDIKKRPKSPMPPADADKGLYTRFRDSGETEWRNISVAAASHPSPHTSILSELAISPLSSPTNAEPNSTSSRPSSSRADGNATAQTREMSSVASVERQFFRSPKSRQESNASSFISTSSYETYPVYYRVSDTFDAFGVYNHTPTNLNFPVNQKSVEQEANASTADTCSYRHSVLFPSYRNLSLVDNHCAEGVLCFSEEHELLLNEDLAQSCAVGAAPKPAQDILHSIFEKLLAAEYGKGHFAPVQQSKGLVSAFQERYGSRTPSPTSVRSKASPGGSRIEPRKSIIDCIQPTSLSTAAFLRDSYDAREFDVPCALPGITSSSLTDLSIKSRKINIIGDDGLRKKPMLVQNEFRRFIKDLVLLQKEDSSHGIGYRTPDAQSGSDSTNFVEMEDDDRSLFEEDFVQENHLVQVENDEENEGQCMWTDMFMCGLSGLPTVDLIIAVGKEGARRRRRNSTKADRNSVGSTGNMTNNNNIIAERIIASIEAMADRDRERIGLRRGGCISVKYLLALARSRRKQVLYTHYHRLLQLPNIFPELELYLTENGKTRVLVLEFDLDSRAQVEAILRLQEVLASPYPTEGDLFKIICVVDEMPEEGITGTVVDSSLYILEQSGPKPTTKPLKTPKGFENFKFPPIKPQQTKHYTNDQRQLFEVTSVVVESGNGPLRRPVHWQWTREPALASINDALVARVAEIAEDWIVSSQKKNGYRSINSSPRQGHSPHQLSCDSDSVMTLPRQHHPSLPLTIGTSETYPCKQAGLEVVVSVADDSPNPNSRADSYDQGYKILAGPNLELYCSSPGSAHTFLEDSDGEEGDTTQDCRYQPHHHHQRTSTEFDIVVDAVAYGNNPSDNGSDPIFTNDERFEDRLSEVFSEGYEDSIEDYAMVVAKGYRPKSLVQRTPMKDLAGATASYSDDGNVTQYAWMSTDDLGRLKMKVMAAENGRYLGRMHGAGVGPRLRIPGRGPRLHPVANNIKAMKVLGLTN